MKQGLHEEVKVVQAFPPDSRAAASSLYNNAGMSTASGIDLTGFEEAMCELSVGTIVNGTLTVSLYGAATDSVAASSALTDSTGAAMDFDAKSSANNNNPYVIRVRAKDVPRYLFVKVVNSSNDAKDYGVNVLLGKPKYEAVSQVNTVDFTHANP